MSNYLASAAYKLAAHLPRQLPPDTGREVAFAGRSNAGKSSALNAMCNQHRLAKTSKTPGRTQHINFFSIGGAHVAMHRHDPINMDELRCLVADLPGYGYAEVSGNAKLHWQRLLGDYVQQREQLAALVLMMDARRPFTDLDIQMLEWFAPTGSFKDRGASVMLSVLRQQGIRHVLEDSSGNGGAAVAAPASLPSPALARRLRLNPEERLRIARRAG